jgi:hypothetical protein
VRAKPLYVLCAIFFGVVSAVGFHSAISQPASVSFQIHNNQNKVASLEVYDAADMNHPRLVKTFTNVSAGSATASITIATISGAKVGRANWKWDGDETNKITIENGKTYELSSGAETNH